MENVLELLDVGKGTVDVISMGGQDADGTLVIAVRHDEQAVILSRTEGSITTFNLSVGPPGSESYIMSIPTRRLKRSELIV